MNNFDLVIKASIRAKKIQKNNNIFNNKNINKIAIIALNEILDEYKNFK